MCVCVGVSGEGGDVFSSDNLEDKMHRITKLNCRSKFKTSMSVLIALLLQCIQRKVFPVKRNWTKHTP